MPLADTSEISLEELQLAARNHGMPLEALRYPITPAGLHYLLIHYDVPVVDAATWRLEVGGLVAQPLSLSLDELRALPRAEHAVTMECAGNGRARLSPRPVSPAVAHRGGRHRALARRPARRRARARRSSSEDAVEIVFTGLDRGIEGGEEQLYQRSLGLHDALMPDVLLAYEMNGGPLLPQHGFPLRLVVPGWYGMTSVKWLAAIDVVAEPFQGYQMRTGYRYRATEDEEGEPVTRIQPRALHGAARDPGLLHARRAPSTPGRSSSRAAPGRAARPSQASRSPSTARRGTRPSSSATSTAAGPGAAGAGPGTPEPGEHELMCRARDEAGNVQPDDPPWNVGGYGNNGAQRVRVTVR